MAIAVIMSITVVLIAGIVSYTEIKKEQAKQDAIYKTAELAITTKARKADVYTMNYSRYFYRYPSDVDDSEDRYDIYDNGFKRGFEECKKAVLTEILKEDEGR